MITSSRHYYCAFSYPPKTRHYNVLEVYIYYFLILFGFIFFYLTTTFYFKTGITIIHLNFMGIIRYFFNSKPFINYWGSFRNRILIRFSSNIILKKKNYLIIILLNCK